MEDPHQAAAAIVYLVIYFFFLVCLVFIITTRRPRYMFVGLTLFVSIRLGSQVSGLGFAIVGYNDFGWLIAYLVLGAEGYFALILTALLMTGRYEDIALGHSWIHPKRAEGDLTWGQKRRRVLMSGAFWLHMLLIPGNVLTIVGGSKLSSAAQNASAEGINPATDSAIQSAMHIRLAGQCLFFVNAVVASTVALYAFWKARKQGVQDTLTMGLICCTIPFILVRGAFGILSSASYSWSYYNLNNYSANGIRPHLLVGEYVMGTTMECIAAGFLLTAAWRLTRPKSQTKEARQAAMIGQESPDAEKGLERK